MKNESLLEETGENPFVEAHGMANVTVRADADCQKMKITSDRKRK